MTKFSRARAGTGVGVILLGACFALLWSPMSSGCDLTIRQAGFINKDLSAYNPLIYRLQYVFESETPAEKKYVKKMRDYIDEELPEVNIEFDTFALDTLPARDQKAIREDKKNPPMPFTMLFYGQEPAPWRTWKRKVTTDELKELSFSDTKTKLNKNLVDNYCVLLLAKGTDEKATACARAELAKFVKEGKMPVAPGGFGAEADPNGPKAKYVVMEMTREAIKKELPFAAVVSGRKKFEESEPWLGVIFGKGKMMDEVLVGKDIVSNNIYGSLAILEQSCSCSVDIQTFTTDLIMKWTEEQDERIIKIVSPEEEGDDMWDAPANTDEKGNLIEDKKDEVAKSEGSEKSEASNVTAKTPAENEKVAASGVAAKGETKVAKADVGPTAKTADFSKTVANVPVVPGAAPAPSEVVSNETQKSLIFLAVGVVVLLIVAGGAIVVMSKNKA